MFEFDPQKSAANFAKHGIDFEQVQALWRDDRRIIAPARSETEPRLAVIGQIDGRHWTAFFTFRAARIRLISARRARREEVRQYERQVGDR